MTERTIKCDTLRVTLASEDQGTVELVIPAYTRGKQDFHAHVDSLLDAYMAASERIGMGMSTGDFALYLIKAASTEPRYMEGRA